MGGNAMLSYPDAGEKIDAWDKDSKHLIKIIATKDICLTFNEYSSFFYSAARIIAEMLLEPNNKDIAQLDTYLFPLAFLYRHSIELKLKSIAFQTINTPNARSNFVKDTFHNLEEILNIIKSISSPSRPEREIDWLKKYFSDISKIDKKSDSFRYPFHIKSTKIFNFKKFTIERIFDEQTHIDLVKFANKFEAAYEILDKWYRKSPVEATGWKEFKPAFIEDGGSYYSQSVVGYAYTRDDFDPYTVAYLETANYLRRYMEKYIDFGSNKQVSGLFIPMCYLYRNCVELNLKTIWFEETGNDFQKFCKSMVNKKHSIVGMWNLIKPFAEDCASESGDIEYIKIIEDYCMQLHDIDPDSSKFRYPVTKDMKPYFKQNKRFDFMHTGIFLESLNNGLGSICKMLSYRNEQKAEMEHEYSM